jgi:hypothetical protein
MGANKIRPPQISGWRSAEVRTCGELSRVVEASEIFLLNLGRFRGSCSFERQLPRVI